MSLKYTIQQGDTLSEIAERLGVDMMELAQANDIEDANKIFAGKKLSVPSRKEEEAVKVQEMQEAVKGEEAKERPKAVEKDIIDKALDFFIPSASASPKQSMLEKPKPVKKEESSDPILPSNVRQFLYDLAGGEETFTEKDLKSSEKQALLDIVSTAKGRGSSVIEYEDYETTAKGKQYEDVGGEGDVSILSRVDNPAYSVKSLLGQAAITKDEEGNIVVVDRYNFNNAANKFNLFDFVKGASSAGFNLYKQARNVATHLGSGPGKGSPVVINLGKINV